MTYKILAYLIAFGIPFLFGIYQYSVTKYEHSRVVALEDQIERLKTESEKALLKSQDAKKKADQEMRRLQDESNKIMNTQVSRNCRKAILWSIQQRELLK